MLDVLEVFRIRAADHPLVLTLTVLAVLLMSRRLWPKAVDWAGALLLRACAIACVASLFGYALIAIWYAADPHFFDNAEPTMIAVGWLFHVGQPIYPSLDGAERYAHVYGPLAFMVHGYVLGAVGPGIRVAKALSVIAALLGLGLVFAAARPRTSVMRALVITGVSALFLLMFRHYSFWTRPEPFELLAVAAAMAFAASNRRSAATAIVGVAAGALVNLKFTGPLYLLPAFATLRRRHGWSAIMVAVAIAATAAAFPFVALSNVSLGNYMTWLRYSASTGIVPGMLVRNIEWAAFSVLPVLLRRSLAPPDRTAQRSWTATAIALGIGMIAVSIAGAKPGAGPYHLIPFVPVIAYLAAWQILPGERSEWSTKDGARAPIAALAAVVFVAVTAAIAIVQQAYLVTTMAERARVDDLADIRAFAQSHEGVIEMGYGKTEWLTLARPVLVFRNNSYLIDQPAVREYQLQGVRWPSATIAALENCRVDYWLIAKGETPFGGVNVYPQVQSQPLYPEEFRNAFLANYVRVDATRYFDVWRCRRR
jgi:hypothetical protein